MKATLRKYKSLTLTSVLTFGAALFLTASAAEPQKRGSDILHLNLSQSITGVDSGVDGSLRLKYNQQGHSTVQSLDVYVSSLGSTMPYVLLASTVEDTNLKPVTVLEPDVDGVAKLRFRSVETGNGKVHSLGKGKTPLPAALDPLSNVRQLAVATTDGATTQVLATATLENPEHLSYLVKRDISTQTVPASLRIQANDQRGQFRLTADNLEPSTDYWLVLNGPLDGDGGIEQAFTTDAKGKLVIRFTIENPLEALALKKVQVRSQSEVALRDDGLTDEGLVAALSASLVLEVLLP